MFTVSNKTVRSFTKLIKYNYLPISNYYVSHKANPKLNAKFIVGGEELSTRIELFENKALLFITSKDNYNEANVKNYGSMHEFNRFLDFKKNSLN